MGFCVAAFVGGVVVIPLVGPQATLLALAGIHAVVFAALSLSLLRPLAKLTGSTTVSEPSADG